MPSRCITERHAGAFTLVPGPWEADGEADRWLVRRCATCRHLDVVSLIEVDVRYMLCLHCLSQDVALDERSALEVEEMERRAQSSVEKPDEDDADDWSS